MELATQPGVAAGDEVLFLVVQALSQGPFAHLGEALAREATAQGLLPRRHDVHGAQHALTWEQLQQRYTHLPPNALQQLLSQLLARRRQEAPQPAARGLTSLLESGTLSVLSSTQQGPPPPPAWLRPGRTLPSTLHRALLLRQCGLLPSGQHPQTVQPPGEYAKALHHHITIRGHRYAVYCITYDRTGRYIITGSDDRLVKIWSARTGLLQASCRGHDAEITDLSVSADNCLVASSSMDATIRVWSLQLQADGGAAAGHARPGLPVSVLLGHADRVTWVDFHPTLPDALLSASFDGTCRIWRAREPWAPPVVLHVDPTRFGLSGHAATRLGGLGWQSAFAGTAAAAAAGSQQAADGSLLDLGAGLAMRTTRNMERQLLGLTAPAGAAGTAGQAQRQSARSSRQLRNLNELLVEDEASGGEAGSPGPAGQGQGGEGEDGEAAGGAAEQANGLLVCGFSRDGTHIVAGGNDCNVYVWQWPFPQPAPEHPQPQPQQQLPVKQEDAGGGGVPAGLHPAPVAAAAAATASLAGQSNSTHPAAAAAAAAGAAVLDAVPDAATDAAAATAAGGAAAGSPTGAGPVDTDGTPASAEAAAAGGAGAEPISPAATAAAGGSGSIASRTRRASRSPPAAASHQHQHQHQMPGQIQGQQQQQQQGDAQGQAARQQAPLTGQHQRRQQAQQAQQGRHDDWAPWPTPRELCQLRGHRNDVVLLQFSHDCQRVATGSKDGSVRVWCRPRRWRKRLAAWEQESTFAVLPDPEAIKEARRRRRPPPAPSIDQIAWSADDQRLVVSVTDNGIRVLAMPGGQVLHHLKLHDNHVHILECHPTDPSLAFSASYDGLLAVWDIRAGTLLRKFSSRQTRPDGRSWPDLIPFADGHFSPDGSTITVTDVAGQLHHYALGPRCTLLARAPYDQFLTTDYNVLIRDLQHNVVDAETQLPPHIPTGREGLCDALGTRYPEPMQLAYRAQHVLSVPAQDAAWREPGKEPGYLLAAPTLTAAAWAVEQMDGTEHAVQLAIARAQERLTVHEDRLNAGASAAVAREAAAEAGRARSRQRQAAWAAAAEAGAGDEVVLEPASSGEMYSGAEAALDSDEDIDSMLLTSEEDEEEDDEDGARQAGRQRGGGGSRRRRAPAAEASRHSSRLAARSRRRGDAGAGPSRVATRGQARGGGGGGGSGAEEGGEELELQQQLLAQQRAREREERQRADREARAARRRAAQQEQLAEERHRRQRAAAARRRRSSAGSSEEEEEEEEVELSEEEEAGSGNEADPSTRAPSRSRRRTRADMEEDGGGEEAAAAEAAAAARRQSKRQRRSHAGGGRAFFNYSWLAGSDQTPGVYVPQAGDAVVYLRDGHKQYLESTNDKRPPPWHTLRHGRTIRPAEPCRVVDVQYVIANDGSDHTLAQLTLMLCDEASPLKDTCFAVEVPPPVAGHAEYVIHRSRFEASLISKCWEVGEQCQVYWNDDEATGAGKWWVGTIQQDARGGRNADVLADPFGAGELWNRFEVEWHGVVGPDGGLLDEQAENSMHCPWELYVPGTTHQAAVQESPTLDAALSQRMLAAVQAASQQDRFVIFVAAPDYDEMYCSRNRRNQYYNRLVALPLSLHEISARLRSSYYRQPEALASDIATIASNAVAFNGEDSEIAEDGASLASYLTAVLRGEDVGIATYAAFPEDQEQVAAAAPGPSRPSGSTRARSGGIRVSQQQQQGAAQGVHNGLLQQDAQQQQVQQQQQQAHQWPAAEGQSLQLGLPPMPPQSAGGQAAGRGGMRVRFTVPSHLRQVAEGGGAGSQGAAAATEHAAGAAGAMGLVSQHAAAGAAVPAASAEWLSQLAGTSTQASGDAPEAGLVPAGAGASAPDLSALIADVAATIAASGPAEAAAAGGGSAGLAGAGAPPAAIDTAAATVAAAAPPDWLAATRPTEAWLSGTAAAAPGGAQQQSQGQVAAEGGRRQRQAARRSYAGYAEELDEEGWEGEAEEGQQQALGRRSTGRRAAARHRSYAESDGEGSDGEDGEGELGQQVPAIVVGQLAGGGGDAGDWAHAFQQQRQVAAPAVPPRQRRKQARPQQAEEDDEWVAAGWEEEEEEEDGDWAGQRQPRQHRQQQGQPKGARRGASNGGGRQQRRRRKGSEDEDEYGSEDSYQPEDSGAFDSDDANSSGDDSGGRRRTQQQRPSRRSTRRR